MPLPPKGLFTDPLVIRPDEYLRQESDIRKVAGATHIAETDRLAAVVSLWSGSTQRPAPKGPPPTIPMDTHKAALR